MRQQSMSLSRVAVATVAIVSMSVSAFGQSGQSMAKPSADAAAAQDASVRHLTVDEAVKLALEQNLGVQIQRIDPQVQDEGVAQARSAWLPNISSSFTKNSNNSPSTSSLSGTASTITSGLFSGGVGVNELLPWGGSYNASWGSSRSTTTDISSFFNPILRSNVTANFTQPLLRNFTIDTARQNVAVSKKIRDISDVNLHATMVQTARSVKNAYWDLVYQIDNLKAAQESLDLAQQSLKDNTRRVEIGTMAPIDIVDAKVEVARNEEAVILAQEAIDQAQDTLRMLIFDPKAPGFWTHEARSDGYGAVPGAANRHGRRGAQRARQARGPARRAAHDSGERHQHPLLPEPDSAGRERAGQLPGGGPRRRRSSSRRTSWIRPRSAPTGWSWPNAASGRRSTRCSRARTRRGASASR